jgi:hypothetical protein
MRVATHLLPRFGFFVVVAAWALVIGVTDLYGQTFCNATSPAAAPSCSRTVVATASVVQILRLELSTLNTAMAPPDLPQFDSTRAAASVNELPLTTGPVITVKSNRAWDLQISAASASFSFSPDAVYHVSRAAPKPASDLAWSISSSSGFVPISATTPSDVQRSLSGGSFTQLTVYYRTRWVVNTDIPGNYELNVAYTLTGR